jgi:hypothetical protein
MNSNNIYKVLRRATDEEINGFLKKGYIHDDDIEGAWLMHIVEGYEDRNNLVFHIPKRGKESYIILMTDDYTWDGAVTEDSPVAEAIKNWELKQQLSPNTLKTFNDLIDEL